MADTKKRFTWAEIKAKIRRDHDLESETFIREQELLDLANEAIDEAEAEIHSLYEDYFLDYTPITLVVDQEEYDLPDNIYAHKIRRVLYNNGSSVYTVNRIQDWKKFEARSIAQNFSTSDLYQYFLVNQSVAAPKIFLVPKSREAGQFIEVWYLRNANRLAADDDICDIPEFINFVFRYMDVGIYRKEGHPNLGVAEGMLAHQRKLMQGTLAAMTPDAHNEIELDVSFYEEAN